MGDSSVSLLVRVLIKTSLGADVPSSEVVCLAAVTVQQWECNRSSVTSKNVMLQLAATEYM